MKFAPRHAREGDRGGRTYVWPPTGENFTSVTTALNALNKGGLPRWSARLVAEGALSQFDVWREIQEREGDAAAVTFLRNLPWEKRDKSADAGTAVHAAVAAEILGTEAPRWPTAYTGHREQFLRFCDRYRPDWQTSEATVFSRRHGYAGTLDFTAIIEIDGKLYLVDLKTGERVYEEVALQLSAYRYADWIDLEDEIEHPIPEVDACAVLHLRPRSFAFREVEVTPVTFVAFLHVLEAHRWQQRVDKASAIGNPIPVPGLPPEIAVPSLDELLGVAS